MVAGEANEVKYYTSSCTCEPKFFIMFMLYMCVRLERGEESTKELHQKNTCSSRMSYFVIGAIGKTYESIQNNRNLVRLIEENNNAPTKCLLSTGFKHGSRDPNYSHYDFNTCIIVQVLAFLVLCPPERNEWVCDSLHC